MTRSIPRLLGYATVSAGVAAAGYVGLVTGACPIDLGIGRRIRPLGPQLVDMAAPREVVFDVIAQPYLSRAPRALADKLLGQRWCALVARRWEQTVAAKLAAVKAEAERRASSVGGRRRSSPDQPPPTTG